MRGSGSANAPGFAGPDGGLVGRDAELARLRGLVDPPPADGRVLVLLGEAGMGKTVLLSAVAGSAAESGLTVLPVSGRESERDLAFAGLHQLLRPVLGRVSDLPQRQARALLGAFALSDDPVPADPLLTGMAVLTLLGALADNGPLLIAADDTQWLDDGSLAALAFAARRLDAEPVTVLVAVRGSAPPAAFDRGFPELTLDPLGDLDAGRLLDAQPYPPRGRARTQVLAEAAGNPMALVELSRVIAADPAAGRRWAAEPLRPPDRLAAIAAAQFSLLPAPTRDTLLLAAVADTTDLTSVGLPALSAAALAPAEAAGLVRVDTTGPQFTHPLVRAAIYHAVPFAERTAAHHRIAEAVRGQPDRHAWHLAAAALGPDEQVAALLEETAAQARRRGGMMAAARALERAAELSPDPRDQARRLLSAMGLAEWADQSDWLQELASRVLAVSTDPVQRILARSFAGWALVWSNRHADALATLLSVTADASEAGLPAIAWHVVALAANVAYQTGAAADRRAVLTALARLEEREQIPADQPERTLWLWVHGCLDPFGRRTQAVALLRQAAAGPVDDAGTLGAAAWMLDESELAVTLLREALRRLRAEGSPGGSGAMLSAIGWAYIDSGRWDEALAAAREASDAADVSLMPTVTASADLTVATVLALRGAHQEVQPYLDRALTAVNPAEYRGFAARAAHAAGLAALGEGRHDAAYAQLSQLFRADGTPLHHHVSYLALADFAAAAVRTGHSAQAGLAVERALDPADPGQRLEQLAARARCLLGEADPDGTDVRFQTALSGPAGDAWPFERAQLRLDYGEWLRRQRRINDAKPVLAAALTVFRRLGADPWTQRTQAELRACGVTAPAVSGAQSTLDGLTTQQREIVLLASRGLTNNEIADRLFLSARTVASHLHRAYPKLGIAGRHQLRSLLDQAGEPPA